MRCCWSHHEDGSRREGETKLFWPHANSHLPKWMEFWEWWTPADDGMEQKLLGAIMQKPRPAGWNRRDYCCTAYSVVILFKYHPPISKDACLFPLTRAVGPQQLANGPGQWRVPRRQFSLTTQDALGDDNNTDGQTSLGLSFSQLNPQKHRQQCWPNTTAMIKSRRMRLEGHVAINTEMRRSSFHAFTTHNCLHLNFNFRANSSSEYRGVAALLVSELNCSGSSHCHQTDCLHRVTSLRRCERRARWYRFRSVQTLHRMNTAIHFFLMVFGWWKSVNCIPLLICDGEVSCVIILLGTERVSEGLLGLVGHLARIGAIYLCIS
jgi:hypothetical protein